MKTKAYSYIRMSSEIQLKGASLARQIESTQKYADEKGWLLDDRLQDIGVSAFRGQNVKDGSLGEFIRLCETGEIPRGSVLILESLDRMSRQNPMDAFNLFTSILSLGIDIVTLADEKHYKKEEMEVGDMFISIGVMARAHDESLMKSKRVGDAWARKREKSDKEKLTKKCPAWMELSADRSHFIIDDKSADTVRYVFKLCIDGFGFNGIAKKLNAEKVATFSWSKGWQPTYIKKILKGQAVLGHYQPNKVINKAYTPIGDLVENYYPAVVDEETYYKAQKAIEIRTDIGGGRKGAEVGNLFSRLIKCGKCGNGIGYKKHTRKRSGKVERILKCHGVQRGVCDHKTHYHYEQVEELILDNLHELALGELSKEKKSKQKTVQTNLDTNKEKLKSVSKRRERLVFQFADGDDTIVNIIKRLGDEEQALNKKIARLAIELKKSSLPEETTSDIISNIEQLRKILEEVGVDETFRVRTKVQQEIKRILSYVLIGDNRLISMFSHTNGSFYMMSDLMDDKDKNEWQKEIPVAKATIKKVDK